MIARLLLGAEDAALWVVWFAITLSVLMLAAVVMERLGLAWHEAQRLRAERRYRRAADLALSGDGAALRELAALSWRQRVAIARAIGTPLVEDRDPARITAVREVLRAMAIVHVARRYLASRFWWRRATGLRVLGLIQDRESTTGIVAALDDRHADVRGAALDALADLQDPAALPAIIVRMHDPSLHPGRRAAALAAYGSRCEPFVLELADVDQANRRNYARVLALCGTRRCRPALCRWVQDPRPSVRAAAFDALGRVGLDTTAASLAVRALDSPDVTERAMAAAALKGWTGAGAAPKLARHLDDTWTVAVYAARALGSMQAGRAELVTRAARPDLPGLLARQVLWEGGTQP